MDNMFGSRWLIDELSKLGFSVSYDEVKRYKQSVVANDDSINKIVAEKPAFTQWIADNVDHNISTLDGKGTFHGMGIIAASTEKAFNVSWKIPRQKVKRISEITEPLRIPIEQYIQEGRKALASIKFTSVVDLNISDDSHQPRSIDLLWQMGYFFKNQQPSWSGFMQRYVSGNHPGQSDVNFLPIINLNPSDESCIYSTLLFVIHQAQQLNIETPCITFDQPLFIKAFEISQSKNLHIVVRLGGFHLLMSFLGGIATIMDGSGLREAMEMIYAPHTVNHMLDGKAYARAVRCHFLIEASLKHTLIEQMNSSLDQYKISTQDLKEIEALYNKVINGQGEELKETTTDQKETLKKLSVLIAEYKTSLSESSRTAKLWLQYLSYIGLIKDFIYAERVGDWSLHLLTVKRMLNLFAASGRVNYAKCARLYLQSMGELPEKHPWLHQCFLEKGYHTIRRSDRYWAGLWSDLIIEQVLMRTLKSRGGLSRGRGMSDSVIVMWIYSMHRLAGIHNAMSNLTGQIHQTSEQHVELRESRINRDTMDLTILQSWFREHSPFTNARELMSIATGITATEESLVNCDKAEEVGNKIQHTLDDVEFTAAKIKRSDKVKTLAYLQTSIKIADEEICIDPTTLFSRLIALVMRENDVMSYFAYELSPYPTSLSSRTE